MAIYTKRLAAGYHSSASSLTIFTAPLGVTTVIRCITISCFSSSVNGGYLYIPGTALMAGWVNLPQLTTEIFDMRQVIAPGENLDLTLTASDAFVAVTGYELS